MIKVGTLGGGIVMRQGDCLFKDTWKTNGNALQMADHERQRISQKFLQNEFTLRNFKRGELSINFEIGQSRN